MWLKFSRHKSYSCLLYVALPTCVIFSLVKVAYRRTPPKVTLLEATNPSLPESLLPPRSNDRGEFLWKRRLQEQLSFPLTKVIVLSSNPRSGSSFLADVLTPSPPVDASYFFEPLRYCYESVPTNTGRFEMHSRRYTGKKLRRIKSPHQLLNRTEVQPEEKLGVLNDLFSCKLDRRTSLLTSDEARKMVFRKPRRVYASLDTSSVTARRLQVGLMSTLLQQCRKTNLRLVKTIRLHVTDLYGNGEPLAKLPSDVRLIVLFRDPRAVISSLLLSPDRWLDGGRMASPDLVCGNIVRDWRMLNQTTKQTQVKWIRFEDLVSNREAVLAGLLNFLGLQQLSEFIRASLKQHEAVESDDPAANATHSRRDKLFNATKAFNSRLAYGSFRYYHTYRRPDFNPHAWKRLIPTEIWGQINRTSKCIDAIRLLNYEE